MSSPKSPDLAFRVLLSLGRGIEVERLANQPALGDTASKFLGLEIASHLVVNATLQDVRIVVLECGVT